MPDPVDPFSDLQEKIEARLESLEFFSDASAGSPRPIEVITEKLGDIENRINLAVQKLGCCVLVTTPIGDVANANNSGLIFDPLNIVVRAFENVTVNRAATSPYSKQPASWIAIAVAFGLHGWTPDGFNGPINVKNIALGNDPKRLSYDVIAQIELAIDDEPQRLS